MNIRFGAIETRLREDKAYQLARHAAKKLGTRIQLQYTPGKITQVFPKGPGKAEINGVAVFSAVDRTLIKRVDNFFSRSLGQKGIPYQKT